MVRRIIAARLGSRLGGLGGSALLVSAVFVLAIGVLSIRENAFEALWLTPDQQGRLAYEAFDFHRAASHFEDPGWKAVAQYEAGLYKEAAMTFGRVPDAESFFNRGNAWLKAHAFAKAIRAFELAVDEAPDWTSAAENLALARYVLAYIEAARVDSDTGDETELGADEIVFDNKFERGKEIVITDESTIEAASAEKWMRSVDTETRDFLRGRFALEASREEP